MEEWKIITDFPNYSVSNFGNVKNNKTEMILKQSIDKDGYKYVGIYNSKQIQKRVHRLVATLFLENPNKYNQIDHIDRNVENNNINNLRWVSHSQNQVNRNKFKNSKNKYIGVSFIKKQKKWRVRISVENKRVVIGYYKNEEEGALAYNKYILDNNLQEFYTLNII